MMKNQPEVLSDWCAREQNPERQPHGRSHKDVDRQKPTHPAKASGSQSDPSNLRTSGTGRPQNDRGLDSGYISNPNQYNFAHMDPRSIAEYSRSSSFTGGFSPQEDGNDDEPNDILVWNYPEFSAAHNTRHRYHGNLNDPEASYSSIARSASIPNSYSRHLAIASRLRSRSGTKSLGRVGSQAEDSNGNDEYENNQLDAVTKQLELIKTTQDNILAELTDDISSLQYENVQLKNINEHLTMQNSHLLKVTKDLSREVQYMREVFRVRGWSLHKMQEIKPVNPSVPKANSAVSTDLNAKVRRHHRQPEKFENIPLGEKSKHRGVSKGSVNGNGPGDEQVASLSNRSNHSDVRIERKSRSKSVPQPKQKEEPKEKEAEPGCFKKLFKSKKKQST